MKTKPTVICLTPVRNEAWILDYFLKEASLWADHIIIADQLSTDGSREIALKFSKVILVDNLSNKFNEPERQKLLINEARKINGSRLLVALDADEFFSPEIFKNGIWNEITDAQPNTLFYFQWANIRPGFQKMWFSNYKPFAFMDDGTERKDESLIHTTRIPAPQNCFKIKQKEIKVIHLQYIDWNRMQSKHRWYQCYEKIMFPQKSPLDIFRMYHHMYAIKSDDLVSVPYHWKMFFKESGIESIPCSSDKGYWWDKSILDFFDQFGLSTFRKTAIWDLNWREQGLKWGNPNFKKFCDPRNASDRCIQWYLMQTQSKADNLLIRKIDNKIKRYFEY